MKLRERMLLNFFSSYINQIRFFLEVKIRIRFCWKGWIRAISTRIRNSVHPLSGESRDGPAFASSLRGRLGPSSTCRLPSRRLAASLERWRTERINPRRPPLNTNTHPIRSVFTKTVFTSKGKNQSYKLGPEVNFPPPLPSNSPKNL